jgi:predicted RNA binding protein YcfA (HicA-like mRNA interferase family)
MAKLPRISGREVVKCFEKIGYKVVRQRGSHIRLRHTIDKTRKPLSVPDHKELGKGLLRKLLRDAQVSSEEFLKLV